MELGVELEDRDLVAGWHRANPREQLLAGVHLRGDGGVEGVEQEDGVSPGGAGLAAIGEGVGAEWRERWQSGEVGGSVMLFQRSDGLQLAILGDAEVVGLQVVDRVAMAVGHDDVEQNCAGVGVQGEDTGLGLLREQRGKSRRKRRQRAENGFQQTRNWHGISGEHSPLYL